MVRTSRMAARLTIMVQCELMYASVKRSAKPMIKLATIPPPVLPAEAPTPG